ncbi:hypothetical protein LZ554_002023 [Drepanopeziza brunnea f. sp. 'monogermtubi']|nr:hypothetical protein LZ554_002023 [Drepanopeziza brunnea f. sp. 'monogermtubi']
MSFSKISALAGLVAFVSRASAHGTVSGIVADGVYYVGYSANYQYMPTQPVVVGWSTPEDTDNGFVAPSAYADPDIICHRGATNAQTSATVKAGGTIDLQWTTWPESHHGPVIDYLAGCGGDCTTVDKTALKFFKIDAVGLVDDTVIPGKWAADQLIANNNTWSVTIPSTIAPGKYVLRHEIIALHSAGTVGGAQNYPQCFNLEVTGAGTDAPTGTLGTALYTETDPGIEVNIYAALEYTMPGPALYGGAGDASPGSPVASSAVASGRPQATSEAADISTSAIPSSPTAAPALNSPIAAIPTSPEKTESACNSEATIARRHARDVVGARAFDKPYPKGAARPSGGAHHQHQHQHPHPSAGFAYPTGGFGGGFVKPTGAFPPKPTGGVHFGGKPRKRLSFSAAGPPFPTGGF